MSGHPDARGEIDRPVATCPPEEEPTTYECRLTYGVEVTLPKGADAETAADAAEGLVRDGLGTLIERDGLAVPTHTR